MLYPLVAYNEEAQTQVPNVLRRQAGGDVPGLPADTAPDSPECLLAELARDLYATTLLAAEDQFSFRRPFRLVAGWRSEPEGRLELRLKQCEVVRTFGRGRRSEWERLESLRLNCCGRIA